MVKWNWMLIEIRCQVKRIQGRWLKRIRSENGYDQPPRRSVAPDSREVRLSARAIKILSKNERRGQAARQGRREGGEGASGQASERARKKGISGRRGILKAIRRYTSLCSRWHAGFLCVAIGRIPQETATLCSRLRYQYAPSNLHLGVIVRRR